MNDRFRDGGYWAFQATYWCGYALIGIAASTASLRNTGGHHVVATIIGFVLYAAYSAVLTDRLCALGLRRGWLTAAGGSRWRPLFAGVVVVVGIQTLLAAGVNRLLDGRSAPLLDLAVLGVVAVGTAGATTMWLVYLLLFYGRRRRREREAVVTLTLREAELRALEAQVSPHFLFNCLNSIRALVAENPVRAQEMITRLSGLLRHNLRHDLRHLVPLANEVEAVRDYLALEAIRFEDRLHVRIEVEPEALRVDVPSMLLQTLVENAVKHGIATRPDGGHLFVRAHIESEELRLHVENSGVLQSPEPDPTRLGLANARERLQLLYGGRATISLASRPLDIVTAEIHLPLTV